MKAVSAVIACSCAAGALAFTGTPVIQRAPMRAHVMSMSDAAAPAEPAQMSRSVPFLKKPKNLDGLVGNAEFDPFSLAEFLPVKFVQESELKHGRVAMLAVVGFVVSELIHLPGAAYSSANPVDAVAAVGPQPMLQIFAFCGLLETLFHKGKVTMDDMHSEGEVPGEYGFDPLGVTKDQTKYASYKLSEVKNGRLAMMAIGGLISQSIVTGHGVPFN